METVHTIFNILVIISFVLHLVGTEENDILGLIDAIISLVIIGLGATIFINWLISLF